MAHFCPVAPTKILSSMHKLQILGHHHLLLAHDVILPQNYEIYKRLFDPYTGPFMQTVILDNSVIELGSSVELDPIRRACEIVRPHVVVLPDVMHSWEGTIRSCGEAIDAWWEVLRDISSPRQISFMYVPQGKSIHEFVKCAEAFATDTRIGWWGIPRNLVHVLPQRSRSEAVYLLNAINPKRKIHMLGFSDDMVEDLFTSQLKEVYSIDSAVPLRIEDEFRVTLRPKPRSTWWEHGEYGPHVTRNLKIVRNLFEGRGY